MADSDRTSQASDDAAAAEDLNAVGDSDEPDVASATAETLDAGQQEWVALGGGQPLDDSDAQVAAARFGARLVLLAGEFESGKTTLVVELYARFLSGAFAGWRFGGSKTLIALDRRYFPSRYASGNPAPTTARTGPPDEGLLHLRLVSERRNVPLFFTDLRGERFEHVIDGAAGNEEIPYVERADVAIVLIDGAKIGRPESRQVATQRARLLIGGLTEPGAFPAGRPMAILLSKQDLVDPADLSWFMEQGEHIRQFAIERGADPVLFAIAARPAEAPEHPVGLEHVLDWLTQDVSRADEVAPPPHVLPTDRLFWRADL